MAFDFEDGHGFFMDNSHQTTALSSALEGIGYMKDNKTAPSPADIAKNKVTFARALEVEPNNSCLLCELVRHLFKLNIELASNAINHMDQKLDNFLVSTSGKGVFAFDFDMSVATGTFESIMAYLQDGNGNLHRALSDFGTLKDENKAGLQTRTRACALKECFGLIKTPLSKVIGKQIAGAAYLDAKDKFLKYIQTDEFYKDLSTTWRGKMNQAPDGKLQSECGQFLAQGNRCK